MTEEVIKSEVVGQLETSADHHWYVHRKALHHVAGDRRADTERYDSG